MLCVSGGGGLGEIKAHLEVKLIRKRAELAEMRTYGEFTPPMRSLYREITALRRRLSMIDAEIAQRQRAA